MRFYISVPLFDMRKNQIVFLLALLFAISCSTDVELNAPYKSTTVVFALLDPDANEDGVSNQLDTQWVKINRTFLGEGNNLDYAQRRDSSEYKDDEFTRKVIQRIANGSVAEEYELISKTVSNKSVNGIFYGPEQTLYYFIPPANGLNQTSEYKLVLDFVDKESVEATTNITRADQLSFQIPQPNTTLTMATTTGSGVVNYASSVQMKWQAAGNASIYTATLRFHFVEKLYDNPQFSGTPISVQNKFVDFVLGTYDASKTMVGESISLTFSGQSFFTYLGNKLEKNPNIRREIGFFDGSKTRCFDAIVTMGNEELSTYIAVNSPATGIIQERPVYSNVVNGLGLFASRSTQKLRDLSLTATGGGGGVQIGNLVALVTGLQTAGLNFCDPNPTSDANYRCN